MKGYLIKYLLEVKGVYSYINLVYDQLTEIKGVLCYNPH